MVRWILFAAAFTLGACASKSPAPEAVTAFGPKTITLKEGDRTPAGEPQIRWISDSRDFEIQPGGGSFSATFIPRQVMEWTENEAYNDFENVWQEYSYPSTCERYVCTGDAGGDSPAWNRFFSAPKAQKPTALAEAIKGIGEVSARKLVDANHFSSKPRSWDAFTNSIDRAQQKGLISKKIAGDVTEKYKSDNMVALGYTQNVCRTQEYSCIRYDERLVQVPVVRYRPVNRQREMNRIPRDFQIIVENPILQNFEREYFSVEVGPQANDIMVRHTNTKTVYESHVDAARRTITLTGIDRLKLPLPGEVFRGGKLSYAKGSEEAILTANIDGRYIPEAQAASQGDQLVMRYVVGRCPQNWLGYCKGDFKNDKEMYMPVTGSQVSVRVPIGKNERIQVVYSFARVNSRYYNDQYTNPVESDKVNRNK